MKNLSIGVKAAAVFAAIGLAMVAQGYVSITRLRVVDHETSEIASNWVPSIIQLSQVRSTVAGLRIQEGAHILAQDHDVQAQVEGEIAARLSKVQTLRKEYERSLTPAEAENYADFSRKYDAYLQIHEKMIAYSKANANEEAVALFRTTSSKAYDDVRFAVDRLVEINRNGAVVSAGSSAGNAGQTLLLTSVMGCASVVLALGGALLVLRGIIRPIGHMTNTMSQLAEGKVDFQLPEASRTDEIGAMARAIEVFRRNKLEADRLAAVEAEERQVKERRAERLMAMTRDFDSRITQVLEQVSGAANEMERTSTGMSATAEETSRQATSATAAANQAAANVQTVAAAADELSASIREIGRQVSNATQVSDVAVNQGQKADNLIKSLTEAAERIDSVVRMITDIASQTNLLALNATVEASRAGEAGRGFAVVASEVKQLANQTAQATKAIAEQIQGVQRASQDAALAIDGMIGVLGQISSISSAIAAAVEQQSAATEEIARNVEEAATGTTEVTNNVAVVHQAANDTGQAAGSVLDASGRLARQSEELRRMIHDFLSDVRAA